MGQQKHAIIDALIEQSRCKYCGEAAPDCTCDRGQKKYKVIRAFKWLTTAAALVAAGVYVAGTYFSAVTPEGKPVWAYWALGFIITLAVMYWTAWCIARAVGENLKDME